MIHETKARPHTDLFSFLTTKPLRVTSALRARIRLSRGVRLRHVSAIKWTVAIAVVSTWIPAVALAAETCAHSVCVEQAWARATPGTAQTAAIYMTIKNNGAAPDKLSSASTPAAKQAQVHQTMMTGNMAHMDMVEALDLPANGKVTLAPNGYHVMLTGLKSPLKEGSKLMLTLEFGKAGKVDVPVSILSVAATGFGGAGQSGAMSNMPGMGNMDHSH